MGARLALLGLSCRLRPAAQPSPAPSSCKPARFRPSAAIAIVTPSARGSITLLTWRNLTEGPNRNRAHASLDTTSPTAIRSRGAGPRRRLDLTLGAAAIRAAVGPTRAVVFHLAAVVSSAALGAAEADLGGVGAPAPTPPLLRPTPPPLRRPRQGASGGCPPPSVGGGSRIWGGGGEKRGGPVGKEQTLPGPPADTSTAARARGAGR